MKENQTHAAIARYDMIVHQRIAMAAIKKLGFGILDHSPHSLELTPSDYCFPKALFFHFGREADIFEPH